MIGVHVVWGQVRSANLLPEGAGYSLSSIMGYSAYPAQRLTQSGLIGMYGSEQYQAGLEGVGVLGVLSFGGHTLTAGGERFGNKALNHDRFWMGYALPFSKSTVMGLRGGILRWSAKGYEARSDLSIGLGWMSALTEKLIWKVQADGLERFWNPISRGTYVARTSVNYKASEKANLSIEVILEEGKQATIVPCFHYAFEEGFYLRAGAMSNFNSIGAAIGFRQFKMNIETAISVHNKLGFNGILIVYCKF